jgi:Zn ribbon nucleic-acid-binding protein
MAELDADRVCQPRGGDVKVTENTALLLPTCPKCAAEDSMEHVKTDYHNIETHYDECVVCGYRTDPE